MQRTRDLLQKALIELIHERSYDAVTVQDVVERANIGRTTFYLHYRSKEELFIACHEAIASQFDFGRCHSLSREDVLSPEAPPGMASAFRHLEEVRPLLFSIFRSKDSVLILGRMRDGRAQDIEANLRAAFAESSTIPLDVLASYLAGAHIALVHWWLENRRPCTPDELAQTFHRLQRAAIREAFGLNYGE